MDDPIGSSIFDCFLRNLARSGLIAADELTRQLREFNDLPDGEQPYPTELTNLGRWLIARGQLTGWQYAKLNDGKWKGFFLDDYKILDHACTDDAYSYYLAEQMSTGCRVVLRVTPMMRSKVPGQIEYVVVHEFD